MTHNEAPDGFEYIYRKCITIRGKRHCKSQGCYKLLVRIK